MNVYRSFGNLLESWVADGIPCSDPPQPSGMSSLRSVSEDSGVELCSEASLASPCGSLSVTDTGPASPVCPPRAPPPPSSSPLLPCGGGAQRGSREFSTALHLKVEQALQRTGSVWRSGPRCSASLPRDHPPLTTGQRSGSLGPQRAGSQQGSGTRGRPQSLHHDPPAAPTGPQGQRGEEWVQQLSPGLSYLEQVCGLLEEMAWLQQKNCGLQAELEEGAQQGRQTSALLLCDCQDVGEDLSSNQREAAKDLSPNQREAVKDLSSNQREAVKDLSANQRLGVKSLQRVAKETQFPAFRHRSASDTKALTGRLGKKASTRGHHASINELTEQEDVERNQQGEHKSRLWRFKKRDPTPQSDSHTDRQQIQSSDKKASGRSLSQLFSRRSKTRNTAVF